MDDAENIFRLGNPEYDLSNVGGVINWKGVQNMLLKIVSFGTKGGSFFKEKPVDETPVKKSEVTQSVDEQTTTTPDAPETSAQTVETETTSEAPLVDEVQQQEESPAEESAAETASEAVPVEEVAATTDEDTPENPQAETPDRDEL